MAGFGGNGNPFGAPAGGFGSPAPAPVFGNNNNPFGGSAAPTPAFGGGGFGPTAFGQSPAPAFGSSAPAFGSPAPAFGQAASPFGQSSGGGFGATSFGGGSNVTPAPVAFGSASSTPASTGFGSPNPAPAFGSSSPAPAFGSSAPTPAFGSAAPAFGTSAPAPAFGSSAPAPTFGQASAPFGQSSNSGFRASGFSNADNEDMSDRNTPPFGNSSNTYNSNAGFGGGGLSTIQEQEEDTMTMEEAKQEESRLKKKIEERKKLQEEIERKKKRLLERKNQKKIDSRDGMDGGDGAVLNAAATPFVPKPSASENSRSSRGASGNKNADDIADRAARNAVRFGTPSDSDRSKLLPSELRKKSTPTASSTTDVAAADREDLHNATSLIGTCEYMCPDDELVRREKESDIQLLETPQPGTLHPKNWTLRDTVVKRFRRSAADYKLDVPEWVRPPDVLERVCGYLEEWVMDRDRQGGDPRFPQGQAPPPLDVYQFIWDRTRMIRKDLTLQNYVGTGGNCDARAVRCHERIARWHAMCEHQLSHLSDFATAQSQQNIQELGQTLKTLNQFYDDSLNRSIVEVPDEDGNETRTDPQKYSHGCLSDNVQGASPTDFDGAALNNSEDASLVSARIIGGHATTSEMHGTAEAEMRAIYILLTMNNEGGMEVLKYAAKLFQERPAIYHSWQVQLALSVFKAKNENNYARFFSILRSPSTPYLFSCIMFKYVETMRKSAMKTMSRAFGAKKRDTGETVYDNYPLTRLISLLCFEDAAEAVTACKHYSITVKKTQVASSSDPTKRGTAIVICWRQTDFVDPVHPEKGTIIPLHPRKMTKTIESKLKGATRLAVCRGQVSGSGTDQIPPTVIPSPVKDTAAEAARAKQVEEFDAKYKAKMLLKKQQEEQKLLLAAEQEEEEKRILVAALKKIEEEKKLKQQKAQAEEDRQAELKRKEAEAEKKKQEQELEKKSLEEAKARRIAKETEQRRKVELLRIRKEKEVAKQKALKEEAERQRQEQQAKEEEEHREWERMKKLQAEKEAQERIVEEARREKRRQKEKIRLQREEEERRKEQEMQEKIMQARKAVVWRILKDKLESKMEIARDEQRLLSGYGTSIPHTYSSIAARLNEDPIEYEDQPLQLDPWVIIDDLSQSIAAPIDIAGMVIDRLTRTGSHSNRFQRAKKVTCLLKLAVALPDVVSPAARSVNYLVDNWIRSRLKYGVISSCFSTANEKLQYEARVVIKRSSFSRVDSDCDVVLFVVPPGTNVDSGPAFTGRKGDMPRVVLGLEIASGADEVAEMNERVGAIFGAGVDSISTSYPSSLTSSSFDAALSSSLEMAVHNFVDSGGIVELERIEVNELASEAIKRSLSSDSSSITSYDTVPGITRSTISALIKAANDLSNSRKANWSTWPPSEFVKEGSIENYFSRGISLPSDWHGSLSNDKTTTILENLLALFEGSYRRIISNLLKSAPFETRDNCQELERNRDYSKCLMLALQWHIKVNAQDESYIYLPESSAESLIEVVCKSITLPKFVPIFEEDREVTNEEVIILETVENRQEQLGRILPQNQTPQTPITYPNVIEKEVMSPIRTNEKPKRRKNSPDLSSIKRQRRDSRDRRESSAFTKRLEAMLHGDTTSIDMQIGSTSLSALIAKAPRPKVDF